MTAKQLQSYIILHTALEFEEWIKRVRGKSAVKNTRNEGREDKIRGNYIMESFFCCYLYSSSNIISAFK